MLNIISLGAGVQSTALSLMAATGAIGPSPDYAIFADTGWEPYAVYNHLDWLEKQLPFPVLRVSREGPDLGQHAIDIATRPVTRTAMPPWFLANPYGMAMRQCSKEFKTRVISKKIRELLGISAGQRGPKEVVCSQWLGISLDEMQRMKDAEQSFIKNRFPLIEQKISRQDCLNWMRQKKYPQPPKSSCIFCPYKSDRQWRDMKDNAPDDWIAAVDFDSKIRPGHYGMKGEAFLHKQRVPLNEVDLSTPEDHGQLNMFNDECEGMCGV